MLIGLMNYHSDGVNIDGDGDLKISELDRIAATGRKAGVWGWYTADNEIKPAMHVRIEVLQNYFRSLPDQARSAVTSHSIDDNLSGLNIHNLYVAGKLMQDPTLNAGQLLGEFVTGFVGADNVEPVTAALRAIEQARTRSVLYGARVEDAVAPPLAILKNHKPLPASWGWTIPHWRWRRQLRVWKSVELAPNLKTAWPVPIEPAEYLDELRAHLEAIGQMLVFLRAVHEVESLQAAGATSSALAAAIRGLPKVEYDPAHTAGMEADIYKQKLAALEEDARLLLAEPILGKA